MTARTSERPPLPNLTSLRFFAAFYVVVYHMGSYTRFHWLALATRAGYTGVDFFFILSGFILAYNYPKISSLKRFYVARFARIYPMYFVALVIALPLFYLHADRHELMWGTPLAFMLLQSWWPPLAHVITSVAWTMPTEAFFYLTFPFALPFVVRRAARPWFWVVLFGVCAYLPGAFVTLWWEPHHPGGSMFLAYLIRIPLFRLPEFLIGALLGSHFVAKRPEFRGSTVLLAFLCCIPFLVALGQHPSNRFVEPNGNLIALPFAALIYTMAGWRSRFFAHPVLQLGGEISYSIYLVQTTVVGYMFGMVRALWHRVPEVTLGVPVIFLVAYFCYRYIEKPARTMVLGWFGQRSHPKPIETSTPLP